MLDPAYIPDETISPSEKEKRDYLSGKIIIGNVSGNVKPDEVGTMYLFRNPKGTDLYELEIKVRYVIKPNEQYRKLAIEMIKTYIGESIDLKDYLLIDGKSLPVATNLQVEIGGV